jgi:hypothetical protein
MQEGGRRKQLADQGKEIELGHICNDQDKHSTIVDTVRRRVRSKRHETGGRTSNKNKNNIIIIEYKMNGWERGAEYHDRLCSPVATGHVSKAYEHSRLRIVIWNRWNRNWAER